MGPWQRYILVCPVQDSTSGSRPRETSECGHKKAFLRMFTAALLVRVKSERELKCNSMEEWIINSIYVVAFGIFNIW